MKLKSILNKLFLVIILLKSSMLLADEKTQILIAFGFDVYSLGNSNSESQIENKYIETFRRLRALNQGEPLPTNVLNRFVDSWKMIQKNENHKRPKLESSPQLSDVSKMIQNDIERLWMSKYAQLKNRRPKDFIQFFIDTSDVIETKYWFLYNLFYENNFDTETPSEKIQKLKEVNVTMENRYPEGTKWLASSEHRLFQEEKRKLFKEKFDSQNLSDSLYLLSSDYIYNTSVLTGAGILSADDFKILVDKSLKQKNALTQSLILYSITLGFQNVNITDYGILTLIEKALNETSLDKYSRVTEPESLKEKAIYRFNSFTNSNLLKSTAHFRLLIWMQQSLSKLFEDENSQILNSDFSRKLFTLYFKFRNDILKNNNELVVLLKENFPMPSKSESYTRLNDFWMGWYERELLLNYKINNGYKKYSMTIEQMNNVFKKMGLTEWFQNNEHMYSPDTLDDLSKVRASWNSDHFLLSNALKCVPNMSRGLSRLKGRDN